MKSCTQPPSAAPTISQSVPGEIAELRGQCGADERAGPGNRGKMVADENPFAGRNEIVAVFQTFGGSGARIVQRQNFRCDELGVEAIRDQIGAHRRHYEPHGIERLAAFESDGG